jgi:hypothetical protein
MKRKLATSRTTDLAIAGRIFTGCWLSASLGVSILQMTLLAQAWFISRSALVPACMVSSWVLGSLLGARLRATPRLLGGCLVACVLLFPVAPRLISWRVALVPTTFLDEGALVVVAWLLGTTSTAWLMQPRPWPTASEGAALARGLIGTTTGLFIAWVFPAFAGLMALTCMVPLLALDCRPAGRSPLPAIGGAVENWVSRYWTPLRWQVQLDERSLPHTWWWSYLVERARDSRGFMQLSLLASSSVIMLGAVWGAVPTSFAASLAETHELSKLGWLLGGQIVALAVGTCSLLAARNVVGFPDRLVPASWQARAFSLALSMLVILAGSLVTLGLPFLQAPWWLAVSLASYTLAGAIWGLLLPRLRPSIGTHLFAYRHGMLRAGACIPDTFQLAHGLAQETLLTRQITIVEGVLIAFLTPMLGWLIDVYGSSDRVLILGGLCFLLGLTVLAFVRVLWSLKHTQHAQVARSSSQKSTARSWRPAYSPVKLAW